MTGKLTMMIGTAALLFCLALGSVYRVAADDKVKIKGLITTRTGDDLTLKTADRGTVKVVLTDDTKVQQPKGLGLRKKQMSAAVLIPGLKVSVDGVGDPQSAVTANTINFDPSDLQLAETIQAGLTPTQQGIQASRVSIQQNAQGIQENAQRIGSNQQQISANQKDVEEANKRFSDLTDYDVKGEATVNFAVGSSAVSAQDKGALAKLARDSVNLTGYIIEVKGFADSSGNAAMNEALSMDRAQAVIAYLIQDCNVPIRQIVAPGAMGTADPAAPNETADGRAANRRVEVKVLVNRGLAGQ
jgi:OmpA-OmpF porin, OOP family